MHRRKVVLVTTDFIPNIGGVAQHIKELASQLVRLGHAVEVITVAYSQSWLSILKCPYPDTCDGIAVWRVPVPTSQCAWRPLAIFAYAIGDIKFSLFLLKRLRTVMPDIVHWHAIDSYLNAILYWRHSARVWTNHTSGFIEGLASPWRRRYSEAEARHAHRIITPSEELRSLTVGLGISGSVVTFISNGVDPDRFSSTADTSQWTNRLRASGGTTLVLCPRRLEKKNGVRYFIEAAIRLLDQGSCDACFVVAGDFCGSAANSDTEAVIARLAKASHYKKSIVLLGRVENRDMPSLYAAAGIVVIPSLIEATSLSALEAMAAAKPIVASDVGGLPFLVRDGENGILVPPENVESLAEAIASLLKHRDRASAMGQAGRQRVEQELSWRMVTERTVDVYEEALAAYRGEGAAR